MSILIVTGGGESCQPYANPRYWDGHTLGQGETVPDLPRTMPTGAQAREVLGYYDEYNSTRGSRVALETFRPGTSVNAEQYRPGDVFVVASELLLGANVTVDDDPSWDSVPVPLLPTIEDERFINEGVVQYMVRSHLSFVSRATRSRPQELVGVYMPLNRRIARFTPVLRRLLETETEPIEVGRVHHNWINRGDFNEGIRRVTQAALVARGTVQPSKARRFLGLGRFATGTAGA